MQAKGQVSLEIMAAVFVLALFFIVTVITVQHRTNFTDAFEELAEEAIACRKTAGIISFIATQGDNVQWTGALDFNFSLDSNSQLSLPESSSHMFCRYFALAELGNYSNNVIIENQNGRVVISNV